MDKIEKIIEYELIKNDPDTNITTIKTEVDGQNMIVILRPDSFTDLKNIKNLCDVTNNNRFYKYKGKIENQINVSIIYPALKEDLDKFSSYDKINFFETPDIYNKIVKPKIINQDLTWVYNILNGKSENDKIFFANKYFVLMPDIKWDGKSDSIYCLAIVKDKSLKSIRDLRDKHINLLQSLFYDGLDAISKKYNINKNKFRAYFHYHPSYWHMHIHYNLLSNKRFECSIDKSYSLWDVINNIKLKSNFYETATLEIIKPKFL